MRLFIHNGKKVFCLYRDSNDAFYLINELKRQGCTPDDNGKFKKFKATDIDGIINAMQEDMVAKENEMRKTNGTIFDLGPYVRDPRYMMLPIWQTIDIIIERAHMFTIYNFLRFYEKEIVYDGTSFGLKNKAKVLFTLND